MLLELAEVNAQVTRLRQLSTAHTRTTRRLTDSMAGWERQVAAKTQRADDCDRIAATARGDPDQAWYNHRGHVIPGPEVAGYLAHMSDEVMASEAAYPRAIWRGLRVSLRADRKWREITPVATISAGTADLTVELNPAWTAKGQHWRIEKEITTAIDDAASTARRLRDDIDDLRQRVTDAARRIGEPFPHAAELEAARTRRDAIEQEIRDAAAPKEPAADGQDSQALGAAAADEQELPDLTEADEPEQITITPVLTWPETTAPTEDITDDRLAGPGQSPEPATAAEQTPVAADEQIAIALAGQPPGQEVMTPAPITTDEPAAPVRAVLHPVLLAGLDGAAEPLFPLPLAPSGRPAASRATRAGRPARPRGARRTAGQVAASDGAVQPALFDLSELTADEPTRPTPAEQASTRSPRK